MEHSVRRRMPAALLPLIDEIENAASIEIETRRLEAAPAAQPGCADSAAITSQLFFGADSGRKEGIRAEVTYVEDIAAVDSFYRAPFAALCCELLRLKRYLVDMVPFIFTAPLNESRTEGFLEHLIVARQLRNYGFDFPLISVSKAAWLAPPPQQIDTGFKYAVLEAWAKTELVTDDPEVKEAGRTFMEQIGALQIAENYAGCLKHLTESPEPDTAKRAMVALTCVVVGFSPSTVTLAAWHGGPGLAAFKIERNLTVTAANGTPIAVNW